MANEKSAGNKKKEEYAEGIIKRSYHRYLVFSPVLYPSSW